MANRAHHWVLWTHSKRTTAHMSRQLCCTCGLLWLRNEVSNRAARRPCPGHVDD